MTGQRVLIVGAGPVGLAAALAFRSVGLRPLVADGRARGAARGDARAIALAHGSRQILDRLGVWPHLAATPIGTVMVSQEGGFGRARIEARDHGIDALGHVVRLGPLVEALAAEADRRGIEVRHDSPVGATASIDGGVRAAVGADAVDCALLVRAEGSPGPGADVRDYGQTALVTEVEPRDAADARAWERFTAEGPLALLPLERGFSVVWCMRPPRADALMQASDAAFLGALSAATGFTPYRWTAVAPRHAFPLTLARRRADAVGAREVAIGNASQMLHPVAGQGLNLGLRDAFELALALRDGIDGSSLHAWQRRRAGDRNATVAVTDAYVSLFSNQIAPLRAARGAGLALVDTLPWLRTLIARRMMFGSR
ncbi:MAG: FAD-dependent monooxygenase [Burkholderiales bacterium]|nr:FAD-dependent monooxygenase [Burkholderiales bacterium]